MINAIIVDDEEIVAGELKQTLEACCPDVRVSAICSDVKDTQQALNKCQPELVLMDVQLAKGHTSFDLLSSISPINFDIIFTTAYNKYAIQAIKFSAIDYLLKPVDERELKSAIEKFKNKKVKADSIKTDGLLAAWHTPGNQQNKIPLPTSGGYDLVSIADIVYCEGFNNDTLLVLNDNKKIISNMTLRECEAILAGYKFVRIHKSHLINLSHIKKYIKGKEGTIVTSTDVNLTVSRNFKDTFIEKLKAIEF